MVQFENPAWHILSKCEKVAGFWPYQEKKKNYAIRAVLLTIIISVTTVVVIRFVKEWNVNLHIVLENMLFLSVHFVLYTKFSVCIVRERRRKIFERVALRFKTTVEEDEAAILRDYSNKGLKFTINYTVFLCVAIGLYDIWPVARMYLDYFLGNGSLDKRLPFYVDYLVDEEEYFFHILVHVSVCAIACIIIEFGFELDFFLTVRHTCALFEIVKLRLKRASETLQQCNRNNQLAESDEQKVYEIISSAVDLHIEALELTQSIDKVYRGCWFIVLIFNMSSLAPIFIMVVIYVYDPIELLRRSLILAMVLVHFYVIFLQGQMTTDHSSSIYEACYDLPWYDASKRSRFAITLMMTQCLRPSRLTGLLFDLSMETYSTMLKTALSYVSMFAALDIPIPH